MHIGPCLLRSLVVKNIKMHAVVVLALPFSQRLSVSYHLLRERWRGPALRIDIPQGFPSYRAGGLSEKTKTD